MATEIKRRRITSYLHMRSGSHDHGCGYRHGHGRGDRRGHYNTLQTHDDVNQLKDKSMIKCYFCEKYRYYAMECRNKKCVEEANLTFTDNEEPTLMLAEKMPNLLILNEEKIMADLFADG